MSNRRRFTLLDAIDDPQLFAPWFRDRATWQAWFVFLRALFGLPLSDCEFPLYRECTGLQKLPVGMKGGKIDGDQRQHEALARTPSADQPAFRCRYCRWRIAASALAIERKFAI